jgi:hypothetical protein
MHARLADAVLLLHFGVVAFVVGGLVVIIAGNLRHWHWVNRRAFRFAHAGAIAFVVLQAWLGQACPLTTLEAWLRAQAGQPSHDKSFIEHWIEPILFFHAPPWVFTSAYTAFGLLVLLTWWRFPPTRDDPAD